MKKESKGILDRYERSFDEELFFAEELLLAQTALSLAELLEKSNVSQRELSRLVGVTEGRISQILNADNNPAVRTIARIAKALGHTVKLEFSSPSNLAKARRWPAKIKAQLNDDLKKALGTRLVELLDLYKLFAMLKDSPPRNQVAANVFRLLLLQNAKTTGSKRVRPLHGAKKAKR